MSHKMNIIAHPEPDFDLEAELPAELAALADQLTADADFLSSRFPAHPIELQSESTASTTTTPRGSRWWLRAAAIVTMLTGLGTVLNNNNRQLDNCTVENGSILIGTNEAAVTNAVLDRPVEAFLADAGNGDAGNGEAGSAAAGNGAAGNGAAVVSRIARLAPEAGVAVSGSNALLHPQPVVTPERTFHAFSSAEQEALLDLNTSLRDASVDF